MVILYVIRIVFKKFSPFGTGGRVTPATAPPWEQKERSRQAKGGRAGDLMGMVGEEEAGTSCPAFPGCPPSPPSLPQPQAHGLQACSQNGPEVA